MDNDDQLLKEREQGHRAQLIIDNPLFVETWEKMDARLMRIMSDPSTADDAVMEARRGLIVLRRLKSEIETVLKTGEMANIQLDE